MSPDLLAALALALLGGGGLVAVLDRWRYRRRPELDIAALAQDVATRALEHARGELAAAYDEAAQLRAELAAARTEIGRLTAEVTRLSTMLHPS